MTAPAQRPHGLGPNAIEIVGDDWAHCFVAIGENVHFEQPRPIDVETTDNGLTVLGRASALALADAIIGGLRNGHTENEQDLFAGFEAQTFADVGVPIAALFQAIGALRPRLVNDDEGATSSLVDAAMLQAHVISVADIIAHAHTDEDQDEALIAGFTAKLRETVAIARLLL